ncbi:CT20-domain-containing protein [Lindgomyces ingoldianus]|uniref:CT20-domain-containing protein n=1 Tax=Lindgomyces ingoldianus TaxID=673940 RepID=A0ACB6R0Y6_9PLEO|nr:CT20-domain-containing protein [Lindgomyces ingoldianus]KAF2472984.1 CT20-domain-containing protein [Lindgomyces ingoldianus]
MPPRKRAKASAASTPLAETQPKTPQDTGVAVQSQQASPQNENLLNDPWTDEQETQLFKGMMKWKPTGLHKHFRMISIQNNMRSHGFVTPDTPHTRIPGIWQKLHQLYDLNALDEREFAYTFHNQPDPLDPTEAAKLPQFELPEDEFGGLMWERRFHGPESVASSSPPLVSADEDRALYHPGIGLLHDLPGGEGLKARQAEAAESASGATPTPKNTKASTRASRAAAAKKGQATKLGQAAKHSKAQSAVSDSAEDEDEDDNEEEDTAESEEETAPSTRKTGRSGGRARPAPRRTRKR